jgi:hypothetical protein
MNFDRWPGQPEPMKTSEALELQITLDKGKLELRSVRRIKLLKPGKLPRFRGRFRVELYSHKLLRDVVRFDFPLGLAAGERTPSNIKLDRSIAEGLSAHTTVRVPFDASITRVQVVSRIGQRLELPMAKVSDASRPRELPAPKRTGIFFPAPPTR